MQKKERMANLEVLRCVAMMMVVVLHYLGKGGLLPDLTVPLSVQDMVAWLLEAFCIVAVNVYMMISGYFLCESSFKLSRLLTLWLQLWLYSVGIGVLAVVTGISIARAFLKDAPIILMDEATASLDVDNETLIQESLSRLIRNKTVMIIAHRMRTVADADKIVVLKDGVVAEQGTPAELEAKDGIYRHMKATQMEAAGWKL